MCCLGLAVAQESNNILALDLPIRNSLKFNKYLLSPTLSFAREDHRNVVINNKRELVQVGDAPQTYMASYSGRFTEKIGAGLGVFQRNFGVFTTFGGILNFAYNAQLSAESNLTFGLNLAAYSSGINTGQIITTVVDPALNDISTNFLSTVSPGFNYGSGFFDFGVTVNNLITYNVSTSDLVKEQTLRGIQGHLMYTGYIDSYNFFDNSKFSALARAEFREDTTIYSGTIILTVPKGFWVQGGYNTLYGGSAGIGLNITSQIALEYNYERSLGDYFDLGASHEFSLAYTLTRNRSSDFRQKKIVGLLNFEKNRRKSRKRPTSVVQNATEPATASAENTVKSKALKTKAETISIDSDNALSDNREKQERIAKEEHSRLEAKEAARVAAAQKAQQEAAEQDRLAREEQIRLEAEEAARLVAAQKAQQEAEEQDRLAREEQSRLEAEEATRVAAAQKAQQEAAEQERLAREEQARREAEEAARVAAAQKAQQEAEEQDRLAREEQARLEAEEATRVAAAQKAQQEAAEQERLAREEQARLEAEEAARVAAAQKAQQEAAEQDRLAREEQARLEAEEAARVAAVQKAQQQAAEQDRLAREEQARLEAEEAARVAAVQKVQQEAAEQNRLAREEQARREADEAARVAAAQKAQQEAEEQERLAREEQSRLEAEEAAQVAAVQKAQQEAEEQNRLAREEQARREADEAARVAAAQKAQQEAEEQERLAREEQSRLEAEEAARVAAAQKAQQEAEEQDSLDREEQSRLEAEEAARIAAAQQAEQRAQLETLTRIKNPTDELGRSLQKLTAETVISQTAQSSVLDQLKSATAILDNDLKELKNENDLRDQGILVKPRAFKSVSQEKAKITNLQAELDRLIKSQDRQITELKEVYTERVQSINTEDATNQHYAATISTLSRNREKTLSAQAALNRSLDRIEKATQYERKRRIKRASFNSEKDRYRQDQIQLTTLKKNTPRSNKPLQKEDFDFGEPRSQNIQILKNVENINSGYYVVLAVHASADKRDDFVKKVIASGNSEIQFFYDINTSKYYLYYKSATSLQDAKSKLELDQNLPYNNKVSLIKIEN